MNSNSLENVSETSKSDEKYKFLAAAIFTGVAAVSLIGGFSRSFASIRRQKDFARQRATTGSEPLTAEDTTQQGVFLALKALGIATLFSIGGVSLLSYSIWKISGASDFNDFRHKMGSILPKISSDKEPVGRTDFDSLRDLFEYLSTLKSEKDRSKETDGQQ